MPILPPPNCEKCAAAMYQVANIPPVSFSGQSATVFMCTPCNSTKWIEDNPTPTLWR